MSDRGNYWLNQSVTRRTAMRSAGLAATGLAGAALIGCGSDDPAPAAPPSGGGGGGTQVPQAEGTAPTAADGVRIAPGIYDGPIPPTAAELNPAEHAKYGGTAYMRYLDPPRMDINRTLSCTIYHTLSYTNNKIVRAKAGAAANPYLPEVEPDLAESWEINDDSTQFTFHFRKGVMTHDREPTNGREFTAEDVKASVEMYRAGGSQQDVYSLVTSVDTPDDYTVVFNLSSPQADFPTNIAAWSWMYVKELVDNEDRRQEIAVGTGPFLQEEWSRQERSVFVRNPNYFEEGLPYLDRIITAVQNDTAVQRSGFQTGNFFHWVPRDDADMEDMFNSTRDTFVGYKTSRSRGANVNGWQFQMNNPTFQDERVRRGLSLGFDREEYDYARNGGDNASPDGAFSNGPMPWAFLYDQQPTAAANGPWYKYDPEQGSQLLQAAGFSAQNPLRFTLQSFYFRQEFAEIVIPLINGALPEVNITWRELDNPTHVTLMSDRNFEETIGFLWGPPGYSMDQWIYPFLHSTGGLNYGNIDDAPLDSMLEAQRAEADIEAKKGIWQDIWDHIHDTVYQAWWPEPMIRTGQHNYLMNFRDHGLVGSHVCYSSAQMRSAWLEPGAPHQG